MDLDPGVRHPTFLFHSLSRDLVLKNIPKVHGLLYDSGDGRRNPLELIRGIPLLDNCRGVFFERAQYALDVDDEALLQDTSLCLGHSL